MDKLQLFEPQSRFKSRVMKNKSSKSSLKNKRPEPFLELEKLILDFSAQFANAPVSEIDGKIEKALKQIAESAGFDRCGFWEIAPQGTEMKLHCHYGMPLARNISPVVKDTHYPWIFKNAENKRDSVYFSRLDDLPEDAAKDKASFLAVGIKSSIFIPYFIAGKAIAGMTFSSIKNERKFNRGLINRLKLMGEIITGAFHRKKMEDRYQACIASQRSEEHIQEGDLPLRQETRNEIEFSGIIGKSAVMKFVFSRVEQVAPTDSAVLITGETGTGKGVVAWAIHELSRRNKSRMVVVNCAALTPTLIESELFGREKGAYTGSTEMQIGRFELADKGTLVLDEITELPMDLQAKLLRAIQEGEFERLGSPRTIKVDVRILALTGKNLKEEVARGRFRQDLYYRLNVFPITIPPLRDRKEDIPLFVKNFVTEFNRKMQKEIKIIPKPVIEELMRYSWPGNVRELEHIIERAVIITKGPNLQLGEKIENTAPHISDDHMMTNLAEVEKRHILKVLEKTNWRIEGPKGASILLGLHPNTLRGKMQKLGIRLQKTPLL